MGAKIINHYFRNVIVPRYAPKNIYFLYFESSVIFFI
jgi:hypothetical protein